MADLDFDELDRAVNSLISSTPGTAATSNTVPVTTPSTAPVFIENSPAASVVATPTPVSTPAPVAPAPAAPARPAVSLAGQRSSGRFMDMIHPSADMRSATPTPTAPAPAAPAAPVTPITVPTEPMANIFSMPAAPTGPVISMPQDSPFLSDAKVEKRPLGAFSTEIPAADPVPVPEPTPAAPVEQPKPEAPAEPVAATESVPSAVDQPADIPTPLPAELQNDLLAIESGTSVASVEPEMPAKPAFESNPGANASIPQQYSEKPSTGDQSTGAIYDTNVYHKALPAKTKKKSSWLWIIWILLLLIVGIGAGAAAYFFILPLFR